MITLTKRSVEDRYEELPTAPSITSPPTAVVSITTTTTTTSTTSTTSTLPTVTEGMDTNKAATTTRLDRNDVHHSHFLFKSIK